METRCACCGCVTDNSELTTHKISDKEFEICNFCNKRIKSIESAPLENAKEARELLTADTNGRRDKDCKAMLYRHFYSLGIDPNSQPTQSQVTNAPPPLAPINEFQALKAQVEQLSKDLKKFKRRYYLSKIIGVLAPVLITFIMLIILLKSGLLNTIFEYYGLLSKYAGM